jgi:hypothetical protein
LLNVGIPVKNLLPPIGEVTMNSLTFKLGFGTHIFIFTINPREVPIEGLVELLAELLYRINDVNSNVLRSLIFHFRHPAILDRMFELKMKDEIESLKDLISPFYECDEIIANLKDDSMVEFYLNIHQSNKHSQVELMRGYMKYRISRLIARSMEVGYSYPLQYINRVDLEMMMNPRVIHTSREDLFNYITDYQILYSKNIIRGVAMSGRIDLTLELIESSPHQLRHTNIKLPLSVFSSVQEFEAYYGNTDFLHVDLVRVSINYGSFTGLWRQLLTDIADQGNIAVQANPNSLEKMPLFDVLVIGMIHCWNNGVSKAHYDTLKFLTENMSVKRFKYYLVYRIHKLNECYHQSVVDEFVKSLVMHIRENGKPPQYYKGASDSTNHVGYTVVDEFDGLKNEVPSTISSGVGLIKLRNSMNIENYDYLIKPYYEVFNNLKMYV